MRRSLPTLAFLMPDFHNPTSRSMSVDERHRVVATAEAHGIMLVSDEATADLPLDEVIGFRPSHRSRSDRAPCSRSVRRARPCGADFAWDGSEPASRHVDRLIAARLANDLGAAVIDQLVFAELLNDFDPILEYRTNALRESRDALQRALKVHLPSWRMSPTRGGIASWVHIDEPVSSEIAIAARARGLLIGAGPWFGLDGEFEQFIRVPITADPGAIERAVEILAEALGDVHERTHLDTRSLAGAL